MNLDNNLYFYNSKDYVSNITNPYLLSIKKNNSNNLPEFLSPNSNQFKSEINMNSNNNVKKFLNLDISPSMNNYLNKRKQQNNPFLRHYSSSSNYNINNNRSKSVNENNKKTLILDLDETLVHSAFSPFSRKSDIELNIYIEGENRMLYVLKRPYVDRFLLELSSLYEIVIFTASISPYANPLLDELDKNKCIKYRLFREHCTYENGIYIKDLKIFDRKINNMIIIDNNPLSYDNNIENGIPILSWYENVNDDELLRLLPILKYMSNPDVYDVRPIINKIVDRNKEELDYSVINKIIGLNNNQGQNSYEYSLFSEDLTVQNKYRKNNKSEPKSKVQIENGFNKEKYNYQRQINNKENKSKNYNKMNKNDMINSFLLNSKYNNNIISINIKNKENYRNNTNINVDKMDPYGKRTSIFSPEEYNISFSKSLNFSYNSNNIDNNMNGKKIEKNIVEDINFNKSRNIQRENNYYLSRNERSYNLRNIKDLEKRSLTPKNDIKNDKNNIENLDTDKSLKNKITLIELTKKALHFSNDNDYNKDNNIDNGGKNKKINYISDINEVTYKYNNYFKKEKEIMHNDFINNNNYIKNYKSNKNKINNSLNNNFFVNSNEESQNKKLNCNNESIKKNKLLKRLNSFNKEIKRNDYLFEIKNQKIKRDNSKKNLERINSEKLKSFMSDNKITENKIDKNGIQYYNYKYNIEKNGIRDYSSIINVNYFNSSKQSLIHYKNQNLYHINTKEESYFKTNKINNKKNEENTEQFFDNGGNISNGNTNKENLNIRSNLKKINDINNDKLLLSVKDKNKNIGQNNSHKISSYTNSNYRKEKFSNDLPLYNNNYNKNRANNLYKIDCNLEYGKNLNYKYEIINSNDKSKYNNKNTNRFNSESDHE